MQCFTLPVLTFLYAMACTLSSADISIFFIRNQQFLLYLEIQLKIAFCIILILLTFLESLNVILKNLIAIMMPTKLATPNPLTRKPFEGICYFK